MALDCEWVGSHRAEKGGKGGWKASEAFAPPDQRSSGPSHEALVPYCNRSTVATPPDAVQRSRLTRHIQ